MGLYGNFSKASNGNLAIKTFGLNHVHEKKFSRLQCILVLNGGEE